MGADARERGIFVTRGKISGLPIEGAWHRSSQFTRFYRLGVSVSKTTRDGTVEPRLVTGPHATERPSRFPSRHQSPGVCWSPRVPGRPVPSRLGDVLCPPAAGSPKRTRRKASSADHGLLNFDERETA